MIPIRLIFSLSLLAITFTGCSRNETVHLMAYRVARPTAKLDTIINFYSKALQLEILYEFKDHDGFDGVIFGFPDQQHQLEFVATDHFEIEMTKAPTKENLLVFYYSYLEDYLKAVKAIEDYGAIEVSPENPYWVGKSKTYEDPEQWRVVVVKPLD